MSELTLYQRSSGVGLGLVLLGQLATKIERLQCMCVFLCIHVYIRIGLYLKKQEIPGTTNRLL
jgi:hypothetical protein